MEWVVALVALGALAAGAAGSMARVARRASAWQDHVEARWRAVAEGVGGQLEVGPRRSVAPRRLAIVLAREDALVVVEVNVAVDPGAPSHTRARARYALGRGPVFRAWDPHAGEPTGPGAALPEPLGRRLRTSAPDPESLRAAFTSGVIEHARAIARAIDLRSDGEGIELVWSGVELDPRTLSHALGLVAELAHTGVGALRALSGLEGAVYVPLVEGGPAVRLHRERVDVELSATLEPHGPRCAARTPTQRTLTPVEVEVHESGQIEGELAPGLLDAESSGLLAQVGRATLRVTPERVELAWPGEPALSQAEAGARLVARIAAGSGRQGAFR